jgi:hypothetical protein
VLKNKLVFVGLVSIFLISCGSNPVRISSDDIPSWCNEVEKTGLLSKLTPEAITGEKLLACGTGTASAISNARQNAIVDAKKQILDQLIGRLVSKYSKERLVDNYRDYISYSAFGYDIVEQKVFDIEMGYQTFILIETPMDDLKGTQNALLKKESAELVSDKY